MSVGRQDAPAEWDATVYHRVSQPQIAWGGTVLDRLPLQGTETVIDAGCGSGHLTASLLERLPNGKVIAVDRSANMIAQAKTHLIPRFGDRVSFLQADVSQIALEQPVDAIFSTATFHWVLDHEALFQALHANLRPGGALVAQCGGGPNIAHLRTRATWLLESPMYRDVARGWRDPWEFASPEATAHRLQRAGFTDIATWLEPAPTTFHGAADYREFVQSVVLRAHLDAFPDERSREHFMSDLTTLAAADDQPFTLDYWRLNIQALRSAA
ncbi:MAG: methyltransferase domain-containing protein [Thermomicrobiales bacterium]